MYFLAGPCRFQSAFDKIKEVEGYLDSVMSIQFGILKLAPYIGFSLVLIQ